jgi:hypothetical protein
MIWGDILLHHPDLIRALPKDLLVLDWGYDAYMDRRKTVSKFAGAGLEFWVCPGVATWSSVFARTDVAQANIRKFAEAGREYGATGLLNTDWGDGGHPNLQGHSLHGYACGAEQAWTAGERGDADFDTRFAWAVFRDGSGRFGKLFRALGRTNAPFGPYKPFDYDSYPFAMVWEGFSQLHSHDKRWTRPSRSDLAASGRRARTALDLIADLRRAFPKEKLALDECELAARQTLYGLRRYPLHKAAADALGGVKRLTAAQRAEIRKLHAEWRRFRREFERLWMARSKRSQISYRLGLYRKLDREYARLLAAR